MSGKIIILTGPSGSGKTTMAEYLLFSRKDVTRAITCTTRGKRPNEIDGKDYYFLTKDEFEKGIKKDIFLEYAKVYENYYGSRKKDVEKLLDSGMNVIMVLDVQGAVSMKSNIPKKARTVFITPPSINALKERLEKRNADSAEAVQKRLSLAREEMAKESEFDYVIENDDLEKTKIRCMEVYNKIIG